jgi:formate hydrogenlyase transcriptional activator
MSSAKRKKPVHPEEGAPPLKPSHFEQLLGDLSAKIIALPPDQIDDEIRNALNRLLDFFRIDRISLLRLLPGKALWEITHNADRSGPSPYPVASTLSISLVPWAYRKLAEQREVFSFGELEDLPAEAAADKLVMEQWNVRSGLYIPIAALKSSEYTLGVSSPERGRTCPEEYIPKLRLLGELFVNALERSRAELAHRESEERLHLAATAAQAGFWIMYVDRDSIWSTFEFRHLFHLEPGEELHLERFLSAIHPDDREPVRANIRACLEERKPLELESRIVGPGEIPRWVSLRGNPSCDGAQLPQRLMGIAIDVTERKRMEAELRDRFDEIERLKRQLENENVYLRQEIKTVRGFEKIVGQSDAVQYVRFKIQQVTPTDATVLVLGETGTGKGMVAHAIHEVSGRKHKPLVTVNCAALPANLIESELFGRERGAFTGAHARQAGRFEIANGGTIFLDEVGEMPMELQTKLLRVLQEGEFERLGSPRTIKVDVRVLAATSSDLKADVENGRFRKDLFYRLNVFPISLPPLRMRVDDIPLLVSHFVEKHARKLGRKYETIPKMTMNALQEHSWPGNVRELEHVIERAVICSPGPVLQLAEGLDPGTAEDRPLKRLRAVEREHILEMLKETGWKIDGKDGAASLLGVHPSTLRFRMKKLGIKRPS